MTSYTCIACRVMFAAKDDGPAAEAAELQKAHYKTDWHRYNLKRKVANLPPVTAENFQERVLAQKKELVDQETDTSCSCQICSKHFSTANSYENHLKSKKHREAAARDEQSLPTDVQTMNAKNRELSARNKDTKNAELKNSQIKSSAECEPAINSCSSGGAEGTTEDIIEDTDSETDEWDGEALGLEECLFCPHASESLEKNIKHMTVEHSFFIPDIEYLVDLEGFISYLGEKVGAMRMCLWCGDKSRVFTELKSVQQHMTDKGHCKLFHDGDAVLEYADFYDYRTSYPDFKKEDDEAELMEHSDDDLVGGSSELDQTGYQMVLPSGATVGHRSLTRYYRQKLRPDRQLVLSKNSSEVSKVISHYKALGWTGTTGAAAVVKAKDIAYFQRHRSHHWTNLGVKGNKLQRHFRDQVFGF